MSVAWRQSEGLGDGRRAGLAPDAAEGTRGPTVLHHLWSVVGSGAIAVACAIGLLATSGWLITRAAEQPPVFVLSIAIGLVQAFALARGVARYLHRLSVHRWSLDRLGALRLELFDALEPLVPGAIGSSGAVLSGFVADCDIVAESLATSMSAAIEVAASVLLGAVVACVVAPWPGVFVPTGALAVVGVCFSSAWLGERGADEEARDRTELADAVIETVHSAPELIAFGRDDLLDARLEALGRRAVRGSRRRAIALGTGRAAAIWVAGAVLVVVLAVGLRAHDAHRLSGVLLAVVVFVALAVFDQCGSLPVALAASSAGRAATRRLATLRAEPAPVAEPAVDHAPGARLLTAELDEVCVLRSGAEVLAGVSLVVAPGRRVALVGESGSGKTTAIHALLHFVECVRGSALLGGTSVATMTRHGIACHVGWLDGETYLFASSLADNLRLADPTASAAKFEAVLERVGLGAWRAALPEGLETRLGAGGRPVSAGERQRLGMARILLGVGSVLLLDEPTAHLDPCGAHEVLDALLDSAGARSLLVVSHDEDIASRVDAVVRLEVGRVSARAEVRPVR